MKCEDLEKVVVGDDSEKFFQIGAQMPLLEKGQLELEKCRCVCIGSL